MASSLDTIGVQVDVEGFKFFGLKEPSSIRKGCALALQTSHDCAGTCAGHCRLPSKQPGAVVRMIVNRFGNFVPDDASPDINVEDRSGLPKGYPVYPTLQLYRYTYHYPRS